MDVLRISFRPNLTVSRSAVFSAINHNCMVHGANSVHVFRLNHIRIVVLGTRHLFANHVCIWHMAQSSLQMLDAVYSADTLAIRERWANCVMPLLPGKTLLPVTLCSDNIMWSAKHSLTPWTKFRISRSCMLQIAQCLWGVATFTIEQFTDSLRRDLYANVAWSGVHEMAGRTDLKWVSLDFSNYIQNAAREHAFVVEQWSFIKAVTLEVLKQHKWMRHSVTGHEINRKRTTESVLRMMRKVEVLHGCMGFQIDK